MRVLVTGAQGFVGSHLVPYLESQGREVTGTDREVDVTDLGPVRKTIQAVRPEGIIHLAAQSSVAASWKEPELSFRLNYVGSLCLLYSVERDAPGARVLLVGSSDAYGSAPAAGARPIRESDPVAPESPYARSKAAAERLGSEAAARGLDVVRIRAFTHIGPGQADTFVASSFARQIAEVEAGKRDPVLRVGNLDSVRDVLDVRDVVRAYDALLDPDVPAGTYNIASGRGVSIREMLAALLALSSVDPRIEVDPDRFRPTDHRIGDATKLREATGWEPQITLQQTLGEVLEAWRERIAAGEA